MKIVIMDLRERSEARKEAHNVKLQYVNELTTSLAEETQKHKAELASWTKKLIECKTTKS